MKKIVFSSLIIIFLLVILELTFKVIKTVNNIPKSSEYRVYDEFWEEHGNLYEEDRYLFWKLKPNSKGQIENTEIITNSLSLRENREYSKNKQENTIRIISLGESGTFGYGVKLENTYNKILEKNLNNRRKDKIFEVINAGHCSYTSIQSYILFKKYLLDYKPDIVLTYFGGNDTLPSYFLCSPENRDNKGIENFEYIGAGIPDRKLYEIRRSFFGNIYRFFRKSSLYNYYAEMILRLKFYIASLFSENISSDDSLKQIDKSWRVTVKDRKWVIEEFNKLAKKNNFKIVYLKPPYLQKIGTDLVWPVPDKTVHLLDLLKLFTDSGQAENELYLTDSPIHPSITGHRLIGEYIYRYISKNLLE